MLTLVLALQLAIAKPCPPSLVCTIPPAVLQGRQSTAPVAALADPERPAKWYLTALFVETGVFETVALLSHRDTISQMVQDESREHHAIRWLGVATMGLLTWHLFWGFDRNVEIDSAK